MMDCGMTIGYKRYWLDPIGRLIPITDNEVDWPIDAEDIPISCMHLCANGLMLFHQSLCELEHRRVSRKRFVKCAMALGASKRTAESTAKEANRLHLPYWILLCAPTVNVEVRA